ncbi:MAG: hypothetical protein J7J03_00120 [Methanosarcinales archaeon]|nr:hypothetical protein [Methanosarcinales archaeon]
MTIYLNLVALHSIYSSTLKVDIWMMSAPASSDDYTKWSLIASGEGAGRIAALYFASMRNEAISDRILLLNSARADLKKVLDEIAEHLGSKEVKILETIRRERVQLFGRQSTGTGNFWKVGENEARIDFDEIIRRRVESLGLTSGDAMFDIMTLGGGTGNGSIPYLINQMKHGSGRTASGHKHFALCVWPDVIEADHRHFNAICGLSRLLKYGEDSHQNADMVLLVDNTTLGKRIELDEGESNYYFEINKLIAQAIDLMMAPGRKNTNRVIDVNDYIVFPSHIGVYHVTPCMSTGNDVDLISLESALDDAVENAFFPIDPATATMVWLIVRVPKRHFNRGQFEQRTLDHTFRGWIDGNIIGKLRYSTVTFVEEDIETFDVLLLLGGFKLNKLVPESFEKYLMFKELLELNATNGEISLAQFGDDVSLSTDELNRIEQNLRDYMTHIDDVVERLSG